MSAAAAAAAAAPARSVEDDELLQRELRERVQRLRVSRADVRDQAARAAKTLCTDILAGLKQEQRYPRSFNWRMSNSGSYFDRTKVGFIKIDSFVNSFSIVALFIQYANFAH